MSGHTAPTMTNWRRIVGQRVSHMTPLEARAALDAIKAEGVTIFQPTIKALTNGLNSQSVNTYVIRKLAIRAGIIKDV